MLDKREVYDVGDNIYLTGERFVMREILYT